MTLTHPAAWGPHRRERLATAAARAGIAAPVLLAEPVAAARFLTAIHGTAVPPGAAVVIYDFGGGTFDATVLVRTADGFAVAATDGLPDAGGLDVDAALLAYLGATYASRDPGTWSRLQQPGDAAERRARRVLWEDVRAAKEMLSRASSTTLHLPLFDEDVLITREQLEMLARPIVDRTVAATRAVQATAGAVARHPAAVFLVGGSSRLPLAATLLHRALGVAPTTLERPETVVAEGAVVSAGW